jgi:hypothetical protein|eukprot:SAG25_NODE_79_length_16803_cov_43.538194_14_plen_82_part_00
MAERRLHVGEASGAAEAFGDALEIWARLPTVRGMAESRLLIDAPCPLFASHGASIIIIDSISPMARSACRGAACAATVACG